eukprot:TRINITY_DN5831_c0_g1_i1.p1 TRINITY_DN5831_c0_g1~~TRINITY_DN5831_c0_g1_i1.p1  ORF type:complete len:567 (-),score=145.91 TRINITY_DN5831_c0_g1_i1:119-1819(-)
MAETHEEPAATATKEEKKGVEYGVEGGFAQIPKRVVVPLEHCTGHMARHSHGFSNDVVVVDDCEEGSVTVAQNQRLSMLMYTNLRKCKVYVLDSAVVVSRTCRIVNCDHCEFVFEDVDVRKVECFNVTNCAFTFIGDEVVLENARVLWRERCKDNFVRRGEMTNTVASYALTFKILWSLPVPPCTATTRWFTSLYPVMYAHNEVLAQVPEDGGELCITTKGAQILTGLGTFTPPILPDDDKLNSTLQCVTGAEVLASLEKLRQVPFTMTEEEMSQAYDAERAEHEDSPEVFRQKVTEVAKLLKAANYTVVYTGAGISTSAGIPDFRGPTGAWTMQDKGKFIVREHGDIAPTFAHYAITELARRHLIKFVMTTNMDALHLRTGLPQHMLVEMHGCSYKEWCRGCGTTYLRPFEVSVGSRDHKTGNTCCWCGGDLLDTIVHFSDTYRTPLDPLTAMHHARCADLALVLGTSMNVQGAASYPDKALRNDKGKLIIVNLQSTPYDMLAAVRIYARTDVFTEALMAELNIDADFDQSTDMLALWAERYKSEQEAQGKGKGEADKPFWRFWA